MLPDLLRQVLQQLARKESSSTYAAWALV